MKVPIIITELPAEFGALKETPAFHDTQSMDRDFTYVPGFSELRRQRDQVINEVRAGRKRANEVPSLPVNFRWARCQTRKGEPDSRKVIRAGNRGYRAITKDDVGQGKVLASMPAGAIVAADGTIRQGDTQLMVATAEAVARNEFNKRVRSETMQRGAIEGFEAACKAAGLRPDKTGSAPGVQVEVGQRTQASLSPKEDTVKTTSRR